MNTGEIDIEAMRVFKTGHTARARWLKPIRQVARGYEATEGEDTAQTVLPGPAPQPSGTVPLLT